MRIVVVILLAVMMLSAVPLNMALATRRTKSVEEGLTAFRRRLAEAEQIEQVLDDSETLAFCRDIIGAASKRFWKHGIEHTASDCALDIPPSDGSVLNHFAREVVGIHLVYDIRFFAQHPYAAASFSRSQRTLYLPDSTLLNMDVDDATLQHERVHATGWLQAMRGQPSSYLGWFEGERFKPDSLYLDEMHAYAHDLSPAIHEFVGVWQHPSSKAADLAAILARRRRGDRPEAGVLSGVARAWDQVVAKSMFGRWHVDPVLEVLPALQLAAGDSAKVHFTSDDAVTLARVDAAVGGQSAPFAAFIYLPGSTDLADPGNASLLAQQVDVTVRTAHDHAALFAAMERSLHMIVNSTGDKRDALVHALTVLAITPALPSATTYRPLNETELLQEYQEAARGACSDS
jgi:hypothetical protein